MDCSSAEAAHIIRAAYNVCARDDQSEGTVTRFTRSSIYVASLISPIDRATIVLISEAPSGATGS